MWRTYGLQPFDGRILRILAVAIIAGTAAWLVPDAANAWLNLLLRGGTLTVVYIAGVLLTRTAPELTALLAGLNTRLIKR